MRILELFGGYGSQALALENLGIEFESNLCEIDKYAIQAYNQLHGETFNYGDICSIDETKLPYYDLITYSSPCQDFSVAGKQAGGEKGSGTRSSLLWECERIIRAVKPKYLLMENVKALTCKKFKPLFAQWLKTLESMGYKNWWKVLNAKDYGVPQNRERVFVVSILGGGQYQFPDPIPLTRRLKDVLEPVVDEKYYLSDKITSRFHPMNVGKDIVGSTLGADCTMVGQRDLVYGTDNNMGALAATDYKQPKQILEPVACASRGRNPYNPSDRATGSPTEQRIEINTNGTTNTITTVQKDNYVIEPMALDEQNQYIRQDGCVGTLTTDGSSPKHNNRVLEPKVQQVCNLIDTDSFGGNPQTGRIYSSDGVSPTLNTMQGGGREPKIVDDIYKNRDSRFYEENAPTLRASHCGDLKVVDYRFFDQAVETARENGAKDGDTIDAFNQRVNDTGVSPTLTTRPEGFKTAILPVQNFRIRKLTPRECWRLMGVRDEQFNKLHDISNSQLYKMAGNSIVVDVLMAIFKNLFLAKQEDVVEPRLL